MHLKFQFQAFSVKLKPNLPEFSEIFPTSLPVVWSKLSMVQIGDCSVAQN